MLRNEVMFTENVVVSKLMKQQENKKTCNSMEKVYNNYESVWSTNKYKQTIN